MARTEEVGIIHALPHRVRLRAQRLVDQPGAARRIAEALAGDGAFARVTAQPATGSVLLEDDTRTLDPPALAARLADLVRDARGDDGLPLPLPTSRAAASIGPTRIARAVAHAVAGVNADIRTALDQRADLGTLLPVFFATAGLAEAAGRRELPVPSWFNLLWWSLRSFMTFNIQAVDEEIEDGPDGHLRSVERL